LLYYIKDLFMNASAVRGWTA